MRNGHGSIIYLNRLGAGEGEEEEKKVVYMPDEDTKDFNLLKILLLVLNK